MYKCILACWYSVHYCLLYSILQTWNRQKHLRGTLILRHKGMCHSNGSLFHKKSLNNAWATFSTKISLNMGPSFPNFGGIRMRVPKNCEKWAYIWRKITKNGCLFLPKWPLKMGRGFKAQEAHPNQIWVPPGKSISLSILKGTYAKRTNVTSWKRTTHITSYLFHQVFKHFHSILL